MQNEIPEISQPELVDTTTRSRRSLFLGSVIGATAIIGSVFTLSAVASANGDDTALVAAQAQTSEAIQVSDDVADAADTSTVFEDKFELDVEVPEEYQAHHDCIDAIFENSDFVDGEGDFEIFEEDVETEAAFEACDELLPEKDRLMNEAFDKFDECLNGELGVDDNATKDAWDSITEADWDAAESACEQHLPAEILEMEKAWEKFDQCLEDNGLIDDDIMFDDGEWEDFEEIPMVSIMDNDKFSIVEFGEGDATVTITRSNGEFTVDASGDATVEEIDFMEEMMFEGDFDELDGEFFAEELPAEFAACEEHLPEDDVFFGGAMAETVEVN